MDREESIERLNRLQGEIQRNTDAVIEDKKANEALGEAKQLKPNRLVNFDQHTRNKYIKDKIGPMPEQPKGLIGLRAKKKEYKEAMAVYTENYRQADREYYIDYATQRDALVAQDEEDQKQAVEAAQEHKNATAKERDEAWNALNEDDLLGDSMKKAEIIEQLIEYFQNRRVDTMKEAVNLYYEEEHRKILEDYAKEQLRLTEEAAEHARRAAESASIAEGSASDARQKADDAMNRANEAYDLADRAWDLADDASMRITSINN